MEPPREIILFRDLEICQPYKKRYNGIFLGVLIIVVTTIVLIINMPLTNLAIIPVILMGMVVIITFVPDLISLINTPLGVNLNHPFVDSEPIGDAVVSVYLSNGKWQELGDERVRLVQDELIKGYNLVKDNEDYTPIGHFSKSSNVKRLQKQIIIINQALGLRDVVNGVEDTIELAREREHLDYGLLKRDWLEEEELEVDGPLAKLIGKE